MSKVQSGNPVHDAACAAADATLQLALVGASQATAKSATITAYRTMRASALANNCGASQFIDALRELGTGGS
jgi:hypothetical protein